MSTDPVPSAFPVANETLVRRDDAVVWHPYSPVPSPSPPLPVVGADGVRLRLADGRELIDAMSSWWAAIHGYRHPVLDEAAHRQVDTVSHVMFGGLTHPPAVDLAERLVALAPGGLSRVFFSDSGSVSVEVAIKMALQYQRGRGRPQRNRLMTVRGGYHGDTFGAMSVCDPVSGMHSMFTGLLPEHVFAPVPGPAFGEPFGPGHFAGFEECLVANRDDLAAVVIEPIVQGAGGMRFYSPGYLRAASELCRDHGVLLIADEIATGFGRSGEMFACDHAGVVPDIMCLGKALTGGYLSMAATLCTDEVAEAVCDSEGGALMHGPTFMANPLAAAISLASVEVLTSSDWRSQIRRIESGLATGLEGLATHPAVADVRVLGAIGVVETVEAIPASAHAAFVDRGVWLRPFGRLLYTMPPYVTGDDDIAAICAAMAATVERFG